MRKNTRTFVRLDPPVRTYISGAPYQIGLYPTGPTSFYVGAGAGPTIMVRSWSYNALAPRSWYLAVKELHFSFFYIYQHNYLILYYPKSSLKSKKNKRNRFLYSLLLLSVCVVFVSVCCVDNIGFYSFVVF